MTELTTQLVHRTTEALESLHEAEAEGDLHLVGIRTGELESLARTAAQHDLDVPALRPFSPKVA